MRSPDHHIINYYSQREVLYPVNKVNVTFAELYTEQFEEVSFLWKFWAAEQALINAW